MRQRLGIAAALLGEPRVVLFDEPVNGLDLDGVRWIRALLRRLADEGRTVLVTSHLMSESPDVAALGERFRARGLAVQQDDGALLVDGMSTARSVTVLLVWAVAVPALGWQRLLRDDANR